MWNNGTSGIGSQSPYSREWPFTSACAIAGTSTSASTIQEYHCNTFYEKYQQFAFAAIKALQWFNKLCCISSIYCGVIVSII